MVSVVNIQCRIVDYYMWQRLIFYRSIDLSALNIYTIQWAEIKVLIVFQFLQ